MIKNSEVQDPEANAKKAQTDRKAGELMGIDPDVVRDNARVVHRMLIDRCGRGPKEGDPSSCRIVVCGAAGSGKTSFSTELAKLLEVKHINLDDYIPGGFTPNSTEYERRFNQGLYEAWEDVPKLGCIIEHVLACSKELVGLYNPKFAILVDPGIERLRAAAEARASVSSGDRFERLARALETGRTAHRQFEALKGEVWNRDLVGFVVKDLRGL